MRAISASMIVLAGAICFAAGAFVSHSDTQSFVMTGGALLTAVGVMFWLLDFQRSSEK